MTSTPPDGVLTLEVSSDQLIAQSKKLHQLVETGSIKLTSTERQTYWNLFDDLLSLINSQLVEGSSKDPLYYSLAVAVDATPEDLEEAPRLRFTTYLDPSSTPLKMLYPVPFFPNADPGSNYSAVWVFTPNGSGYTVRCYTTPGEKAGAGATMQFEYNSTKKWWDISFKETTTQNKIYFDMDGKSDIGLYTKLTGKDIYLVPAKAIDPGDTSNSIVGVEKSSGVDVTVWRRTVAPVTLEYPITRN